MHLTHEDHGSFIDLENKPHINIKMALFALLFVMNFIL